MKIILLICTLFAGNAMAQIPTDNLLVHMNFNQNVTNLIDATNATVIGDPVSYDADRFGNAAQSVTLSNLPQSYLSLGDIDLIDPNYSISFWMRHGTITASTQFKAFSKREACTGGSFIDITLDETAQSLILESGAQGDYAANTTAVFSHPNIWKHVVIVVDQASEQSLIYIDGAQEQVANWNNPLNNGTMDNNASFLIGHSPCVNGSSVTGFLGQMDDLRIYTRPLTQAEVLSLFNEPNPTASISELSINPLSIYPNPASSQINLKATQPTTAVITATNGTILENIDLNGKTTIDVSAYAPGVYFIRSSNGQTVKLIKH